MIVSRPFSDMVRGVGRNALDLPVAAFAAVAVAFLAFAMPADLLTDLVGSSGLPSILPAAEPPLGFKARIGVGLVGALLIFAVVLVLLRLLDRTGLDGKSAKAAEPEQPRTRRRDFHPDAPAPWPISAARDFGEPSSTADSRPLWLDPVEPEPDAVAFAEVPEAFADEPEPESIELEPESPAFQPEPQPFDVRMELDPFDFAPEPEAIAFAPEPETRQEAAPEPVDGSASLAELIARLERGLARARTGQDTAPAAPASPLPAPQVFPEANDDRLQSAIDSLQRLTSRQS